MKLLEAGDLYPKQSTEKRVFDKDFGEKVSVPARKKQIQTKQRKETVDQADHIQYMLDILTSTQRKKETAISTKS